MVKKFLLIVMAALCAYAFSSCSRNDEPEGTVGNLKSVDGTVWTAVYMHTYTELTFSGGKYIITGGVEGYGTYVQDGDRLTFDGGWVLMPFPRRMTEATLSEYGSSMEILFDADGLDYDEKVVRIKFIYDPSR